MHLKYLKNVTGTLPEADSVKWTRKTFLFSMLQDAELSRKLNI